MIGDFDASDLYVVFLIYLVGMAAAALLGIGILAAIGIRRGTDEFVLFSPLLAGVVEPLATKLAPSLGVLYWVKTRREELASAMRAHPFLLGAYGGACVGVVEALGKVVWPAGMYAGVDTVTLGVVAAAIGHVFYGGIIGNAVFRRKRSRSWHNTITATLIVVLIHFSWNAYRVIELINTVG